MYPRRAKAAVVCSAYTFADSFAAVGDGGEGVNTDPPLSRGCLEMPLTTISYSNLESESCTWYIGYSVYIIFNINARCKVNQKTSSDFSNKQRSLCMSSLFTYIGLIRTGSSRSLFFHTSVGAEKICCVDWLSHRRRAQKKKKKKTYYREEA